MSTLRFPDNFLWGTATAAHQVEGGNWNSDWWAWEHAPDTICEEPSGDACDHFFRYPQDMALLAQLGFNTYRFSIEWARIEPEEGEFSVQALDHYRRMIATCQEQGLTPIVTLHHFTSPRWVADDGSWENPAVVDRFARYVERAWAHLGDMVGIACTINEPNIVALHGYRTGVFPPGRRDTAARTAANEHFVAAHRRAVEAVKAGPGEAAVGMTLSMTNHQPVEGGEERLEAYRSRMEDGFLEAARSDDFLGVQTYTRTRVGPDGPLAPEEGVPTTLMGYEFWPEALEATIRRAWEVTGHTPIIVTESGIGCTDDEDRIRYVSLALRGVHGCLEDGIDVGGYVYWSAMDNFEWVLGYRPTFGLIAVDRATQQRTPKPSASWLGAVAASNRMDV